MLDGAEEGDINALAITKLYNVILGMENTLFQEEVTKSWNYGVMTMAWIITVE